MLTIASFSRSSEKENNWNDTRKTSSKHESRLSLGLPDEVLLSEKHRSRKATSPLDYRRASLAVPTETKKFSRRSISGGVTVKRNSSNRSTASEGSKRKARKRNLLSPDDENSSPRSQSTSNVSPIAETAASFLRLVLPFSWERRSSKKVSPNRGVEPVTCPSAVALQPKSTGYPTVPFPQRAPPPVPDSRQLLFGDHTSLSSGSSSLAGHIYEQISFSSGRSCSDIEVYVNNEIRDDSTVSSQNFESCIPGEVRAVKRPSRKHKKSKTKGTYTDIYKSNRSRKNKKSTVSESISSLHHKQEKIFSFSLPQKHSSVASHLHYVDYVIKSTPSRHRSLESDNSGFSLAPSHSASSVDAKKFASKKPTKTLSLKFSSSAENIPQYYSYWINSPQRVTKRTKNDDFGVLGELSSSYENVNSKRISRSYSPIPTQDDHFGCPPPPPATSPDSRGSLTRAIRFTSKSKEKVYSPTAASNFCLDFKLLFL